MRDSKPPSLAQRQQVLSLIWMGMLGAIAVYWVVHAVVGHRLQAGSPMPVVFPAVLIGLSLLEWFGAWWWHARTLHTVEQQILPTTFQRLSLGDHTALQGRLQQSVIICLALLEAPAVYGLINSMIPSPLPHLFEWLAVLSAAFLIHFRLTGYPGVFLAMERLEVKVTRLPSG